MKVSWYLTTLVLKIFTSKVKIKKFLNGSIKAKNFLHHYLHDDFDDKIGIWSAVVMMPSSRWSLL